MARAAAVRNRTAFCRRARRVAVLATVAGGIASPAAMAHIAFPYDDRADHFEMPALNKGKATAKAGPRASLVPAIGLAMIGAFGVSILLLGWQDGWFGNRGAAASRGREPMA